RVSSIDDRVVSASSMRTGREWFPSDHLMFAGQRSTDRHRSARHAGEPPRPPGGLRGAAFGERLEPAAELFRVAAEVLQPWQRREALEAEDAFEERRDAIAN